MNGDSEALQRSLLQLLQELSSDVPSESAAVHDPLQGQERGRINPLSLDSGSFSTPEENNSGTSGSLPSEESSQRNYLLNLGEIPAVQDRFYALLKRRLESEIQRNPPLFPWESEFHEYEAESISYSTLNSSVAPGLSAGIESSKAYTLWMKQLKVFNLPVQVPETILAQLFERCQEMMQSSLLEGAKLVRAVEDLFPDQSQMLNHLAGLVIASPARSGAMSPPTTDASYPSSYETAALPQQMLLSLMAAREIMGALTLMVSPKQPMLEQQWLTELGALTLSLEYEQSPISRLKIESVLPCGGSLSFSGQGQPAIVQRANAGVLNLELVDLQTHQTYGLEVRLAESEQAPLMLTVCIEAV